MIGYVYGYSKKKVHKLQHRAVRIMSSFHDELAKLPREELLDILKDQDELNEDTLFAQVRRIEWVFENKLGHLTWTDGTAVSGRQLTNQELSLLIDEPFQPSEELIEIGLSIEEQQQYHVAKDSVLWTRIMLDARPRAYQILIMRWPSTRLVLRAGRRLGKTVSMSFILLHYAFTHNQGRCIIVAPTKEQVALIYNEILKWAKQSDMVWGSIKRKVASPQYEIDFSNGSTLKFFTSGLKTAGKADITRGQEANIIILDELDYMHDDDLIALYAMLQQTSEVQEPKRMIGASTPTGRKGTFFRWCTANNSRFKEFWYPSYVNPFWTQAVEDEMHAEYPTEMSYRHEIEADWGEDEEGVYPRKFVDLAANQDWPYEIRPAKPGGFLVMGVDWDKYGAGVNMCILEVCGPNYVEEQWQNRVRMIFREEMVKGEYAYTLAVERVIELNRLVNPTHIYVDRGSGECVHPSTLISCLDGLRPISDVEIGNQVLSIDGLYHKVTDKIVRNDVAKETYEVRVCKNLPIQVSSTHPFLVQDRQTGKVEWRNVTEIEKGDFIATPKLKDVGYADSLIIDLAELLGLPDHEYDEHKIWATNPNKVQFVKVNRYIDVLSDDFLRFAGWFLSEGSVEDSSIEIGQTYDSASDENLWDIYESVSNVVGFDVSISYQQDHRKETYRDKGRVLISSRHFAKAISLLFGTTCDTKRIPTMMMVHPQKLGTLINTLLRGDGHLASNISGASISYSAQLTLTSFQLIDQVRLILGTVGIPTSVYSVRLQSSRKPMLRLDFGGGPSITERFNEFTNLGLDNPSRIDRQMWKEDENFFFYPVRSIKHVGEITGLIDIEVEGGESFVGNGLLLHNTQVELLHKHGVDNPSSGLRKKVRGVSSSETLLMTDPASKEKIKKRMKPFMVDNLRQFFEKQYLKFPTRDEELHLQLISYVVARTSPYGDPVFESNLSDGADHAHDALTLACLAITQNYGELMKLSLARFSKAVSNEAFLNTFELSETPTIREKEIKVVAAKWGSASRGPIQRRRPFTLPIDRKNVSRPITRSKF